MSTSLSEMLAAPGMVVVAESYSVLTARVVEQAGFQATYIGGQAIGAMHAGVPDHGVVNLQEVLGVATAIASSISIPLIADVDQGGETSLNVRRTVHDFEHAGVNAIHIEDTINPKHLFEGDQLVTTDRMRARIAAAVNARRSDEFLIIARTDEMVNGKSVDETVRRGIAYAEAGADIFMAINIRGVENIRAVCQAVPIPVLDINQRQSVAEEGGLKIDLFASSAVPTAVTAHLQLLEEIRATGRVDVGARMLDPDYFASLVDDEAYRSLAHSWGAVRDRESGNNHLSVPETTDRKSGSL